MSVNNPFLKLACCLIRRHVLMRLTTAIIARHLMKQCAWKRADIDAIIAQRAAPDFDNTVLALEKSGAMLSRVSSVFFAMTSAHTNDDLQALDEQFSTELAGLANDIWLNDTLFARVEAVWQDREALDAESRRLTEGDVSALCSCWRASERR